jgi:hypothetical protein
LTHCQNQGGRANKQSWEEKGRKVEGADWKEGRGKEGGKGRGKIGSAAQSLALSVQNIWQAGLWKEKPNEFSTKYVFHYQNFNHIGSRVAGKPGNWVGMLPRRL